MKHVYEGELETKNRHVDSAILIDGVSLNDVLAELDWRTDREPIIDQGDGSYWGVEVTHKFGRVRITVEQLEEKT